MKKGFIEAKIQFFEKGSLFYVYFSGKMYHNTRIAL